MEREGVHAEGCLWRHAEGCLCLTSPIENPDWMSMPRHSPMSSLGVWCPQVLSQLFFVGCPCFGMVDSIQQRSSRCSRQRKCARTCQ